MGMRSSPEEGIETISQQPGEALCTVAPLLVDDPENFDPEVRARLVEGAENNSNPAEREGFRANSGILQRLCCVPISGSVFLVIPTRKL